MKYGQIALDLPIDRTFHYAVPSHLEKDAQPGSRVWVPFGERRMIGCVVALSDSSPVSQTRAILSVIDAAPIISDELLRFTKWISDYYFASWGSSIAAAIPAPLKSGKTSVRERASAQEQPYEPTHSLTPTAEQAAAMTEITSQMDRFGVYLLHGITSSGKTEVYLQCIKKVIERQKGAIVLIPEISLTPQTVERFKARFGQTVAVIHSQLTGGRRFSEWDRIRKGEAKVVIGPRSALFSPIQGLGLIVVDEEHETSYKQEDMPRYHARDAAIQRAMIAGCPVILGSATPSLESYYRAENGEYQLLKLTKRIDDRPLPRAVIIDMRKELAKGKRSSIISNYLRRKIEDTLADGKKAMLFLNRRGFATYIGCKSCGYTAKCKKCESILVYHSSRKDLSCHYCGWKKDVPKICPQCQSSYLSFSGKGTEKIQSEMHRLFPSANIDRMDTDATKKRGSHDAILKKVKSGKTDILVGTQMIAKGHDFPQVTLVGVISADLSLNLPDFRSGERTFNLLTQVAGRAGRGKDEGEVVIQTFTPSHYAIMAAAAQDYEKFYRNEINLRKELRLPPFVNIIKITFRARSSDVAKAAAEDMTKKLRLAMKGGKKNVLGPAAGVIPKIRNRYIWNVIIKTGDPVAACHSLKSMFDERIPKVRVSVDVDPVSIL